MALQEDGKGFHVQFSAIAETLGPEFRQHFPHYDDEGLFRGQPGGFVLTAEYGKRAKEFYDFEPRPDDTWIVTFPKCGTTWTQEMVWLIINNCDFQGAKQRSLDQRAPFLEMASLLPKEIAPHMLSGVEKMSELPSPRVIKTHLPLYLLHPKLLDTSKVVYVARNPKDALVSYFFHHKIVKFMNFSGDIDSFAEYFMKDSVLHSPYFPHVLESWNLRRHPNMHFAFFEDFKKDLRGSIQRVADFLGKSLTEEQLNQLTEHLRFDNFAKNESVNYEIGKKMGWMQPDGHFIRKGKTGDWKNHFSPELNERIDRWIESNLKGSDLKFVTELKHQD